MTTRTGGPDVYGVGEVVEPEDPRALAAATLRLARMEPGRYASLCEEAVQTARSYSWAAITEERIQYYHQMPRAGARED